MKVIGFGDNVVDKYQHIRTMYPGGNCINFAVYAKQIGCDSAYLGVFGNDNEAKHIQKTLDSMGIDYSKCVHLEGETGCCEVSIVDGDRKFLGWNEGGITLAKPMVLNENEIEYLNEFDLVHCGCYAKIESQMGKLKNIKPLVTFDFSQEEDFRSDEYLKEVCPNINCSLFSCEEQSTEEIKELLKKAVSYGPEYALATMGTKGQLFFDGENFYEGEVKLVEAVDTMGAGDSFLTAFLIELLRNGWRKNSKVSPEAIKRSLSTAAEFSANNCLVEGSFGNGLKY